jgi:Pyridoxamine 5'-phosphate oxidase
MANNDEIWRAISKGSFAVIGYVTPSGEPRSTGVVYATAGQHLYVAVAPESWKGKHIAANKHVSVTVPIRRGGLMSLLLPIPPATISFRGTATVHTSGWLQQSPVAQELRALVPQERREAARIIEIVPAGDFLTYGVGVSLTGMRRPDIALARVPVT